MAESPPEHNSDQVSDEQKEEQQHEAEEATSTPAVQDKGEEKQMMTQLFGSESSGSEDEDEKKIPEQEKEFDDDVTLQEGRKNSHANSDVMEVPMIPLPRGKLHACKAPQSLAFQEKCFDHDTYDEEKEIAQMNKLKKAAHGSLIRWQYVLDSEGDKVLDQDGRPKVKSNARIVQWADDSFHVQIGSKYFEMKMHHAGPKEHRFVYAQQTATIGDDAETHLVCHGQLASSINLFERCKSDTLARRYHEKKLKRQLKKIQRSVDPEIDRQTRMEKWDLQQKRTADQMEDNFYRSGSDQRAQRRRYSYETQAMSDEDVGEDAFDAGESEDLSIASLRAEFGKGKKGKKGSARKTGTRQKKERAPERSQRQTWAAQADAEPEFDEEEATFELDDDNDDEPIAKVSKRPRRAVLDDEDSD